MQRALRFIARLFALYTVENHGYESILLIIGVNIKVVEFC